MLILLWAAEDVCCWTEGGEDTSEVRFGDVGDTARFLRVCVCAMVIDVALIGDAGRGAGAPNPTLELLVGGREVLTRLFEDTADPEPGFRDISGVPLA
jgi:hypothetical protein